MKSWNKKIPEFLNTRAICKYIFISYFPERFVSAIFILRNVTRQKIILLIWGLTNEYWYLTPEIWPHAQWFKIKSTHASIQSNSQLHQAAATESHRVIRKLSARFRGQLTGQVLTEIDLLKEIYSYKGRKEADKKDLKEWINWESMMIHLINVWI